jgi:hypothetical protein
VSLNLAIQKEENNLFVVFFFEVAGKKKRIFVFLCINQNQREKGRERERKNSQVSYIHTHPFSFSSSFWPFCCAIKGEFLHFANPEFFQFEIKFFM